MTTTLSDISHPLGAEPTVCAAINATLARLILACPPISLDGIDLIPRQFHLGNGWFDVGSSVARHQHAELQLEIPLSGRVDFESDDGYWSLAAGDSLLIAPAVPHRWVCRETSVMLGVLLQVAGPRASAFADWLRAAPERRCASRRSPDVEADLRRFVRQLRAPASVWQDDYLLAIGRTLLMRVCADSLALAEWQRSRPPDAHSSNARHVDLCTRATDFIASNFAHPIAVSDVAIHVGISARHLSRLFHRHLHRSVNQLIVETRLQRAAELLVDRHLTVKEVAFACGFASPSYFTQCFRRQFNRLPRDFQADRG